MDVHFNLPILLAFSAILFAAVGVYQSIIRRVIEAGGGVRTAEFQIADLLVVLVLAGFFAVLIFRSLMHEDAAAPAPIKAENVLPSATFMLVLIAGIAGFLRFREVSLWRLFGFDRISRGRAIAAGLGLVLAAFPIVAATAMLAQPILHTGVREQELVTLFREAARKSDHASILKIVLAGAVFAPIAEEFLFRGYFYGVLKRYAGGFSSAVFTAGLFAAIHLNLASAPSLFVLALCLTIAYESTGCLLVPVTMHALFNLSQLLYLYWDAQAVAG